MATLAQNMVTNGSFEEFYTCPDNYLVEYSKKFLPGWNMATKGTPDYFNRCSKAMVGVPQNFMGSIFPQDGDGFVGIILTDTPNASKTETFSDYIETTSTLPVNITNLKDPLEEKKVNPVNYREYIQTQLKLPLQSQKLYKVSFYYAIANNSTFVVNRLGVHFAQSKLFQKSGVISVTPQLSIDENVVNYEPGVWVQFVDTIRAKGGETYVTIGNFYDDLNLKLIDNDISSANTDLQRTILTNQLAYVYIDNFSVEEIKQFTDTISPKFVKFSTLPQEQVSSIYKQSVYALLDEVYFDPGNIYSPPMSLKQTNTLISYILDNPNVKVEVCGIRYENDIDDEGVKNRIDKFCQMIQNYGIDESRIKIRQLGMKAMPNVMRINNYGIPFDLYSGLIAVKFF